MPAHIFSYLYGILSAYKITATFLQRQFGYSHDQLTRVLRHKFAWTSFWRWVVPVLFGTLSGGWLIIDDTVLAKPFGKKFPQASVVFSSCLETYVFGYNLVFLCWSNGTLTIPLCWRWYKKHGKSKIALAQELLKEAKLIWKLTPEMVLFDSWYAAEDIIDQLTTYGWYFTCRIKKNRIINCCSVAEDLLHDGDHLTGLITGTCRVLVIKNEDRFLATSLPDCTPAQVIEWYARRWVIEDVFRFLKNQLHLEECQARTKTAQKTHLMSCLIAHALIQKEHLITPEKTLYRIKEDWMLNKKWGHNRFRHYEKLLACA
jgi:hypothetical protein